MTIDEIKQALHKADLTLRPNIVFVNPSDAKTIKDAVPEIDKKIVIKETEFVEQGKAYVIDRRKWDEWATTLVYTWSELEQIMGMTIEESIRLLEDYHKWEKQYGSGVDDATNKLIEVAKKYQKIEQILKDIPYGGEATVRRIQEVIEDGSENNYHASNI